MLRSAQPSKFSTYPIQNIDIPGLVVLSINLNLCFSWWANIKQGDEQEKRKLS